MHVTSGNFRRLRMKHDKSPCSQYSIIIKIYLEHLEKEMSRTSSFSLYNDSLDKIKCITYTTVSKEPKITPQKNLTQICKIHCCCDALFRVCDSIYFDLFIFKLIVLLKRYKQDRQRMYNITLGHIHVTTVATEKQYYIL